MMGVVTAIAAASAETRVALVVGNGAYRATTPLANPPNDARAMSKALKAVGFTVIEAVDADKRQLDGALRAFADKLAGADVALFYYAGHGLQVGSQNYLVPIDARLQRERDLEFEATKLEFIQRQMEIDREGKTTILVLDACRDNPLSRNLARSMGTRSVAIGRGLAAAPAGLGTFIAYATQPGNVALDGDGRNSPFTAALVKHMDQPGRNLPATMIEVRKDVVAATGGRQVPWDHSALTGDFYFRPAGTRQSGTVAQAPAGSSLDLEALKERLRQLDEAARERLAALKPGSPAPPSGEGIASTAAKRVAGIPPVIPLPPKPGKDSPDFEEVDNVRIDGIKLNAERKPSPIACREWCAETENCVAYQHGRKIPVMGRCELFGRVDARYEDRAWRSGVRIGTALPSEQSPVDPAARRLPSSFKGKPSRREKGFDIYDGVEAAGDKIKMTSADSPAGCQVVCRHTPGCVIANYNDFFRGKNVACFVYREITAARKSSSSTMMVRTD
jgi:uncharacterized caspase-like protein